MTEIFYLLEQQPAIFISTIFILGLLIGSFLNVVIHRLPTMMNTEWREQCHSYLALEQSKDTQATPYNLITPASHCPSCETPIKPWQNIPIISYLLLRGKCKHCGSAISIRYPLIELLSALLSAAVAYQFGWSEQTVAALILTWALIALSMIDIDHQLLPDQISLPVLWLGLLISLNYVFVGPEQSIAGAAAGYLFLWLVYHGFRLITGKEGMGYGDFKLLALLGAWFGWQQLPLIILVSSLAGAIIGVSLIVFAKHHKDKPIPFGPYLAIAGWISMMWGNLIIASYMGWLLY